MEQVHDRFSTSDRRKICAWIEQTNPTLIHDQSCMKHEEHTCQWIHRVDQWNDWLHLQRRLVWIHGIPGAGKTVLASYLIRQAIAHCEKGSTDRVACLYYYCSFRHGQEEQRDEALPFLRRIVSQLYRRNDHIPTNLVSLYRQNIAPSLQALKVALEEFLVHFDVLYIVIDAVDESNPRDSILGLFEEFITQPKYRKVQLLATLSIKTPLIYQFENSYDEVLGIPVREDEVFVRVLDAIGDRYDGGDSYRHLHDVSKLRMEPSELFLLALRVHYHELTCVILYDSCIITELLDA